MKKGSFNLTGKAIGCRELASMGDAGKEIFRALKVACNGVSNAGVAEFKDIPIWGYLVIDEGEYANASEEFIRYHTARLKPIDVLGQARIDAAKEGARLVFGGDIVPRHSNVIFYAYGSKINIYDAVEYIVKPHHPVIAYKIVEEKQSSIQSRVLSEKMGFKELCPVCSPKDWQDREAETYDELRDAHLELVRENMVLTKENEALAQRIKDLHRAINDAKAALDE